MLDDDDGVEPQFKAVDEYHFEGNDEPVCFSILPLKFDENDEVEDCDSGNKVYLRGVVDKSLFRVHRKMVAWRVGLDSEHPNILVRSSEGNWIRLLKPRKCYKEEIARSILITLQMLHFVRKHHGDKRSLWGRLWDHLDEVFDKLDTKPAMDDLRKHHSLIKLFLERDPILMRSKLKSTGTISKFIDSDESRASNYDGDYDNGDDNSDNTFDVYNYNRVDSGGGGGDVSNGDTDSDDGNDMLCALCDDGGKLLSCMGQCKRSFHPTKKDGRESKCKTLCFTTAQLKEIGTYLYKNCEYQQHQCFKCAELEPSGGPNAKVFKCNIPTCGHFYHPKCAAKLLEPDNSDGDESCELAKCIMAGMSFTCPVHWCFECGRMEDRTQRELQFAVCRRCPKSYHRECLPRGISFETKKYVKQRAWELSKVIVIYCLDHKICKATGNASRDHIKFPPMPKISKVEDLGKKKVKVIGKRKRSVDQCSTKSTQVSNRLHKQNEEDTQRVDADNSLEHMVLKPEHSAMRLKEDRLIEQSMVGVASLSAREDLKRQEKQVGPSSSFVMGTALTSCAVGYKTEKRRKIRPEKKTPPGTSWNIARKSVLPSEGILHHFVQDNNALVDKAAGLDGEIGKIANDKDGNDREKLLAHDSRKGYDTNNDTSHENNEQNDVLGKLFVNKDADGDQSKLKSRKERSMERQENAYGHDYSISGQDKEICRIKNQMCQRMCEQDPRLDKGKSDSGNDGVTQGHVDENRPEKQLNVPCVDKMTITDIDAQQECDEVQEVCGDYASQEEPNSSRCNSNSKGVNIDTYDDGQEAHYDGSSYQCPSNNKKPDDLDCKLIKSGLKDTLENRATEVSGSSRREDFKHNTGTNSCLSPMGRNVEKKSTRPPEGQRICHDGHEQYAATENQHIYQHRPNVNYSSNENYDTRRWSPFPPAYSGAARWQEPHPYPRGRIHGITRWQSPPFYPRSPRYFTTRWHNPPFYPTRPEHAHYKVEHNYLHNLEYDEYGNLKRGGYNAMDHNNPAAWHSLQINNGGAYRAHTGFSMGGHEAAYSGRNSTYGLRPVYLFGWEPWPPAAGSVTDRYIL
ncbi:hypothetical protein ACP70R_015844 [Stipagrostis hirtigluma subsp. patula]